MGWKSSYLAGAAALALLLPGAASAADDMAQVRGFYLQGGLGADWADDADFDGSAAINPGTDLSFDNPGWFGALSAGYDFGWPRIELEGSYRNNDADNLSGRVETWGAMVNVLVDLDFGFPVVPYLGAGVGYAHVDTDIGSQD